MHETETFCRQAEGRGFEPDRTSPERLLVLQFSLELEACDSGRYAPRSSWRTA
jgi:hypothetical protein